MASAKEEGSYKSLSFVLTGFLTFGPSASGSCLVLLPGYEIWRRSIHPSLDRKISRVRSYVPALHLENAYMLSSMTGRWDRQNKSFSLLKYLYQTDRNVQGRHSEEANDKH